MALNIYCRDWRETTYGTVLSAIFIFVVLKGLEDVKVTPEITLRQDMSKQHGSVRKTGKLTIFKDFQGQGIGRKLIAQIIEDANNTGIPVELILLKTNPVKKLYDDLGFYLYKKDMNRYYMSTATMNTATPGKTDCSGEVMNHWEQRYQQLHRWLRPDGVLCILFMQTGAEGGPPFHCDLLKIHRLFDKQQSGCVTAEGN
jgi:GNAT superfamily N-acetyltransferase